MQLIRKRRADLVPESAFNTPSAAPAAPRPRNSRPSGAKRLLGLLTVLVIPGFFVSTTLPAFAVSTPPTEEEMLLADTGTHKSVALQSLTSAADVELSAERSAFTAETHAQVEAKKAAAIWSAARNGAYGTVGPRQAGDDYPYRTLSGLSPLRYVARQCTDFAAWRINRDKGSTGAPFKYDWANMTPNGGSASQWASAWRNNGWKTSKAPVRGAIAWFGGHVAYVKSVSGSNVSLEEYNWNGSASYHTRTIPSSSVSLFLYPPP